MFMQTVKKHFVAGLHCRWLVQDYHVETPEVRTVMPKRFPDDTL
jgi:hypothetical protein